LTNNPSKYGGLDGFGLNITERVPLESMPTAHNIEYLRTKRERMGHLLGGLDDRAMTSPPTTPRSSERSMSE
jgi:3,4-dihydroxy 2-butanone 4-phosphate synthase/GTP cyclohydrolase II